MVSHSTCSSTAKVVRQFIFPELLGNARETLQILINQSSDNEEEKYHQITAFMKRYICFFNHFSIEEKKQILHQLHGAAKIYSSTNKALSSGLNTILNMADLFMRFSSISQGIKI